MQPDLWQKLLAEALCAALLVTFGAGSFMAAIAFNQGIFPHGNLDYAAVGFISFAFALIIALNTYIFGPVSGAQFNSAITIPLAVVGRIPWCDVGPYLEAQQSEQTHF